MTKVKILYIEDEPFLGRIVKESLESRNFDVYMASDGKQAFSLFEATKPDACILDVMLPSKDGYSIAKEIRQVDLHVPIIFVTAKTLTEDVLKGFETGGNDYIRKPFSMEELIARINNLLAIANPKLPGTSDTYTMGQYEFLVNRYELRIRDTIKKLSNREASLLRILCENRNSTVSRKDILMAVWGDDSFFNSRNLDVYIAKLRDYLKQDPSVQIITIKGVGYHFAAL